VAGKEQTQKERSRRNGKEREQEKGRKQGFGFSDAAVPQLTH
jgi:hypothetical protein